MPAAQPSRSPSRQALLAEVQALRQRVAALEQEKHDLEVMLEMATDHADDLSESIGNIKPLFPWHPRRRLPASRPCSPAPPGALPQPR